MVNLFRMAKHWNGFEGYCISEMEIITNCLKVAKYNIQEPMIVMTILDQLPKFWDYFVNDILNCYKVDELKVTTISLHLSIINDEMDLVLTHNQLTSLKEWCQLVQETIPQEL